MPPTPRQSTRAQLGVEMEDPRQVEPPDPIEIPEEPEPERPGWLPDHFKDEAAFVASYKELEDELRRRGENQNKLQAQLDHLTELVESGPQYQPPPDAGAAQQLREQLMASYENDPIGTMAYLAQQYSQQYLEQRLQALQQEGQPIAQQQVEQQNQLLAMSVDRALGDRYDDWGEYKERVAQEIEADPTLLSPEVLTNPDLTMRQLGRIYENLKARDVLEQAQSGNFVQNELSQMKRQAQTISGAGTRPGEKSPDEEKIDRLVAAARGMSYASWREG